MCQTRGSEPKDWITHFHQQPATTVATTSSSCLPRAVPILEDRAHPPAGRDTLSDNPTHGEIAVRPEHLVAFRDKAFQHPPREKRLPVVQGDVPPSSVGFTCKAGHLEGLVFSP